MLEDLRVPPPAGLAPLVEAVRERVGGGLRALVLYGSTRRRGDARSGLVDLMAIVRDYRSVHGAGPAAVLNYMLPPNVYYLETDGPDGRLRCKFILISERSLRARTGGGLDVYFWARFTQPCRCIWRADDEALETIASSRAAAADAFARRAAGLCTGTLDACGFWTRALAASYACELRPEPPGAAAALVASDPDFWAGLSRLAVAPLEHVQAVDGGYRFDTGATRRLATRAGWLARRLANRALHVLRLLKAAGTFTNGVDYLCWKIERHSGVRVQPTERMRRHPRLSAWRMLFRLWRRGALK